MSFLDNTLLVGDWLKFIEVMPDECIDLIYIDPPFFTQRKLMNQDSKNFFLDQWESLPSFIGWLMLRINCMKRGLKKTGVMAVHLDWRTCHYVKAELDKIFGYNKFLNEIVWCYAGGGQSKKSFPKKHDVILIYARGNDWTFNTNDIRVPYDSEYSGTSFKGAHTRSPGKTYRPNPLGKVPEDHWQIPRPYAKESVSYPTQKPLALLERIIKAFSNEGDLVADFFAGSGTTLSAAHSLNRKWLGCDSNPDAIKVIKERMKKEHDLDVSINQRG